MKAVILAGGRGTRISEETHVKPKPMVEIGGMPILWHIMKMFSTYGINDFVVCGGYKGYVIKEYFANYSLHQSDVTFNMEENRISVEKDDRVEPWKITLVDTGDNSMTGGRLKKVKDYIKDEKEFCFTYGDGVSDLDIGKLIKYHRAHGKDATITGVYPPGRFGALEIKEGRVLNFKEKPKGDGDKINGGFFVLSPNVLNRITDDQCVWEQSPLVGLAKDGELMVYEHNGFWQPMDTLRDKFLLEELWVSGKAPWKMW